MEQVHSKEVGMTFTIGQSLTPEQVRNLPDGAKVAFTWKNETDIYTAPIGDNEEIGAMNILRMHLLSQPKYDSATLVSLPSIEPSPGYGYTYGGTGAPAKASLPPELPKASEIEKEAAWALIWDRMENLKKQLSYGTQDSDVVANASRVYLEAYDYARSIGAIE
jgi:hypothetical protein